MSRSIIEHALVPWFAFGDKLLLLAVLRSDKPLTRKDRELIADIIEGKIKLPAKKPPLVYLSSRKRLHLHAAANEVERLKAQWKKETGRLKHGSHKRAIEAAVKKCCPRGTEPVEFELNLAQLLRRPKRDREWLRADRT